MGVFVVETAVLVEDRPESALWLRDCLALLPGRAKLCEAGTVESARALVASWLGHTPAVMLLGTRLRRQCGLELLPVVQRHWPGTRVVVLAPPEDAALCVRAFRAGARGFVLQEGHVGPILQALRSVRDGLFVMTPSLSRYWIGQEADALQARIDAFAEPEPVDPSGFAALDEANTAPPPIPLSPRELELLDALARSWTEEQIAQQLGLQRAAVRAQLRQICRKLSVTSRSDAVQRARMLGLVRLWM
ncbi:MAG TPA: response regulator transcription factor [Burkholderiaceae bacterium]|nr:response regulator transcription factor [Burkholderiaceae bacterium]